MLANCRRLGAICQRSLFTRFNEILALNRHFSDTHFNATDSEVDYVIEQNLDKTTRRWKDDSPHRILTTRREALSLYRDILRVTALFQWPDDKGRLWRDILRDSARREFEAAQDETDPEIVNRLLLVGRDAVHQATDKLLNKTQEELDRSKGGGGGANNKGPV